MRDNVPAWWPILRALTPLLAAFPAHGRERPSVVGRSTPYKDPARDGLHRLKKPGACRGILTDIGNTRDPNNDDEEEEDEDEENEDRPDEPAVIREPDED